MPNKKKKYNARFPPARIKKIMQTDEEVGKVAAAVPVIISRALELFVESLIRNTSVVTQSRNAKTLTTSHLKQCILSESQFDFLKDLVASVPDVQADDDSSNPPSAGEVVPRTSEKRQRGPRRKCSSAGPSLMETDGEDSYEDEEEDDDLDDEDETRSEDSLPPTNQSSVFRNTRVNLSPNGDTESYATKDRTLFNLISSSSSGKTPLDEDYDS